MNQHYFELTVVLDNLVNVNVITPVVNSVREWHCAITEWSKADDLAIVDKVLDGMLKNVDILILMYNECALSDCVHAEIDRYYESVMSCIRAACLMCLPTRQPQHMQDYVVPGWNDVVSEKHRLAREAFLA